MNLSESLLELIIFDDGVGFDMQQESHGLGLRNLQSRMNAISGNISFKSEPQKGTQIKLSVTV